VIVDTPALEKMLVVAEDDASIGIVGSKLLRFDAPDTIQALARGRIIPIVCHDTQLGAGRRRRHPEPNRSNSITSSARAFLVRTEAIRDVGLIDESYFLYREETDWCIRMRRDGWDLYCCPEGTVWHKQSYRSDSRARSTTITPCATCSISSASFTRCRWPVAFSYFAARRDSPKAPAPRVQTARGGC